jgi:hypothetical protein
VFTVASNNLDEWLRFQVLSELWYCIKKLSFNVLIY